MRPIRASHQIAGWKFRTGNPITANEGDPFFDHGQDSLCSKANGRSRFFLRRMPRGFVGTEAVLADLKIPAPTNATFPMANQPNARKG
jgi:hypothetical protein